MIVDVHSHTPRHRVAPETTGAELDSKWRPDQSASTAHTWDDHVRAMECVDRAIVFNIASDPRGCVAAAVLEGELVGYAAFHPPTEVETWGADATGELIELGAVEVAPEHRGKDIARRLLQAALGGGRFDSTVVFATLYAWHYDLPRSGMTDLAYRRMLERLYRSVGLQAFATSDEEVRSSAANALMARIGPAAPAHVVEEFHRLRKAAPEPARSAW